MNRSIFVLASALLAAESWSDVDEGKDSSAKANAPETANRPPFYQGTVAVVGEQ
jgi:hypothetical protein